MTPTLHTGDRLILRTDRPADGGRAVARHDGVVVFVSGALPGERVEVAVTEVRKSFAEASVVDVLEPSPHRVADRLDADGARGVGGVEYSVCGLAHSRTLKAAVAADQFRRLGGLGTEPGIEPAPLEGHGTDDAGTTGTTWRTRVQLSVDPSTARAGMLAPRSREVVAVDRIPLAAPVLQDLDLPAGRWTGVERLEATAASDGGALVLAGAPTPEVLAEATRRVERMPGTWSLGVRTAGRTRNRGGAARQRLTWVSGPGRVLQEVDGLDRDFRLSADGFWQVHPDAAATLSREVLEGLAGSSSVVDLYCGAGLFSVAAAGELEVPVTGFEGSAAAIEDARTNAAGLDARFEVARIEKLTTLPEAEAIVLDPPRAGIGAPVVDLIAASAASKVVYVSCDASTFARDAARLITAGFSHDSSRGHDFFPLTAHAEFVSVFSR